MKHKKRLVAGIITVMLLVNTLGLMAVAAEPTATPDTNTIYTDTVYWTADDNYASNDSLARQFCGGYTITINTHGAKVYAVPLKADEREIGIQYITFDTDINISCDDITITFADKGTYFGNATFGNSVAFLTTSTNGVPYRLLAEFHFAGVIPDVDDYWRGVTGYFTNVAGNKYSYYYGEFNNQHAVMDKIISGEIKPDYDYIQGNRTFDASLSFNNFQCINQGDSTVSKVFTFGWQGYSAQYDEYFLDVQGTYYKRSLGGTVGTVGGHIDWTADAGSNRWTKPFSEFGYLEGAGRLDTITITPYGLRSGAWYYGNSISVSFDEDGNITHISESGKTVSDIGQLDNAIPVPKLTTPDGERIKDEFWFSNSSSDYYIEVQGRFLSYSDFDFKWKVTHIEWRGSGSLYGNLETWISASNRIKSTITFNISNYQKYFDAFVQKYPYESRNFTKDSLVGTYDMHSALYDKINTLQSPVNLAELYMRYYRVENGKIVYGPWGHYVEDLESGAIKQSQSGLTDDQKDSLEEGGHSATDDTDIKPDNDSIGQNTSETDVWEYVSNLGEMLGDVPLLIADVFSFLPAWVVTMIGVSIVFIVVMRFLGR